MIYRIDPDILEAFPDFNRGVVVADGIDNSAPSAELELLFKRRIEEVRDDETISIDHPRISAWYDIYRTFPLKDARKIQPSIAVLVRRIKGGKELPFISPLVCISNLISLTYLVPSGLVDPTTVEGDLVLGYAQGTEHFTPIGGDEVSAPARGEIIYFDSGSKNVMCRAWNSRGGKATSILPTTRAAVIDVDGLLTVIPKEELETATLRAASLLRQHCGARTSIYYLSRKDGRLEFSFS
jgi:DNA/RNA-binding domain of Phe-tRNA-synthetase-like protein